MNEFVDNFELLKNQFPRVEDSYGNCCVYHIEITIRNKDQPEWFNNFTRANRIVHQTIINDGDELLKKKDSIVKLCEAFNARAYIRPNPISKREVLKKIAISSIEMMDHVGDCKILNSVWSAFGTSFVKAHQRFIVDCDEFESEKDVLDILNIVREVKTKRNSKLNEDFDVIVKTVNGFHLLTKPFDIGLFNSICEERGVKKLDIHKNNPTVLYFKQQFSNLQKKQQ